MHEITEEQSTSISFSTSASLSDHQHVTSPAVAHYYRSLQCLDDERCSLHVYSSKPGPLLPVSFYLTLSLLLDLETIMGPP